MSNRLAKLLEQVNSLSAEERAEEIIGWCKRIGGMARTRFVGRWKIALETTLTATAYNLLRLARIARVVA